MIVLDANILSYFARLNRLHLLTELFSAPLVSPNTQRELQEGIQQGYVELQAALQWIRSGACQVLTMTAEAQANLPLVGLPPDKGETDSLAYCLTYDIPFMTNDGRAWRRGRRLGVQCVSLSELLRLFWKRDLLSQEEVREIIVAMEDGLGFIIGDQEAIFSP